ncbi:BQ5605_C022g09545 [Microbotryum silenes-dioicae]|uniref:BQ5605_C022g09545 protein n=1 Tax=Microbotryum silenes-dioicae TaxID=796604 RepID=A0A2X0NDM9_9BASI|nr:BQ5605_C022g09545 [Microbotryum silenes-dioicae]
MDIETALSFVPTTYRGLLGFVPPALVTILKTTSKVTKDYVQQTNVREEEVPLAPFESARHDGSNTARALGALHRGLTQAGRLESPVPHLVRANLAAAIKGPCFIHQEKSMVGLWTWFVVTIARPLVQDLFGDNSDPVGTDIFPCEVKVGQVGDGYACLYRDRRSKSAKKPANGYDIDAFEICTSCPVEPKTFVQPPSTAGVFGSTGQEVQISKASAGIAIPDLADFDLAREDVRAVSRPLCFATTRRVFNSQNSTSAILASPVPSSNSMDGHTYHLGEQMRFAPGPDEPARRRKGIILGGPYFMLTQLLVDNGKSHVSCTGVYTYVS